MSTFILPFQYSSKCFILNCVKKLPFKIKCVQTDNGVEFTNKLIHPDAKPTLFEKTLMELGIEYKRIKPYTPAIMVKSNVVMVKINYISTMVEHSSI